MMIWCLFFLLGELNRTTGFIDIPTAPQGDIRGIFSAGLMYSLPVFTEDPNPNDNARVEPNDFDIVVRYGFGRGEVAVSMYTPTTYSANLKYLLAREKEFTPAVFAGIDDISYSPYVSTVGRGDTIGFLEEKNYAALTGGRPWELLSAYVALQKTVASYFNLVFGLGRGRYVGYGPRSHIFNTDIIALGEEYKILDHSSWAFGAFMGGSLRFPFGLELIVEMDGRDANVGMTYHHKYFALTFALTKFEHFINSVRPFSPRYTFGLEGNNSFMFEGPKIGSIECIFQDNTTKALLINTAVDIKETNKRYAATSGTFIQSLPAGNYTITVSKPDYVDYAVKIAVKNRVKSKFVFNLKKTEEALARESALRDRERSLKSNLEQGKVYFAGGKIDPAKAAFEMVLSLNPNNAEAKDYLSKIEPKRKELIGIYANEAISRTEAKDFAKAIESWQKVLGLDPKNSEASQGIAELQKYIEAAKKPPPVVKKPEEPAKPKVTKAEIEKLYKNGITLFTAERYDDALKLFKQVLALDPNHAGAKDYRNRTEARIKALKGGG